MNAKTESTVNPNGEGNGARWNRIFRQNGSEGGQNGAKGRPKCHQNRSKMTPRPKSGPSMRKLELCNLFWRVLGILRGQVWLSKSSKNRRKTFTNSLQKLMPEMLWILCKRSPELMPKRSQKSTRKLTKNRTDDFSIFVNSITLKSFFRTIAGTWIEAKIKKNEDQINASEMYPESMVKLI